MLENGMKSILTLHDFIYFNFSFASSAKLLVLTSIVTSSAISVTFHFNMQFRNLEFGRGLGCAVLDLLRIRIFYQAMGT
jgi:hypothetical protein